MKYYKINFNSQGTDPRSYTGLSTSFINFYSPATGQTFAPPGISEVFAGSGDYWFNYDIGNTSPISFLIDGGATLAPTIRFIGGLIDPNDKLNEQIGSTNSSFGSTAHPGDIFGYVKRLSEFNEGSQNFIKSSGAWNIYNRGASTLLAIKTLTSSTTGVTAIP